MHIVANGDKGDLVKFEDYLALKSLLFILLTYSSDMIHSLGLPIE